MEIEKTFQNASFECVQTLIQFQKTRRNIYLLEIQKLNRILRYKFGKLMIYYDPTTKRAGNVYFRGNKLFVNSLYDDFSLLFKNFKNNSHCKVYKPEKEIEDYILRKLKHALEYI